jgi:hypothetical protein
LTPPSPARCLIAGAVAAQQRLGHGHRVAQSARGGGARGRGGPGGPQHDQGELAAEPRAVALARGVGRHADDQGALRALFTPSPPSPSPAHHHATDMHATPHPSFSPPPSCVYRSSATLPCPSSA